MSAAGSANPVTLFRRAALLAGLLAVIAGFLGMHTRSDSHGVHGQSPVSGSYAASAAAHTAPVPPSCVCQDGCTEKSSLHIGCTPSPAGASLSAPQPGTTPLAGLSRTAALTDLQPDYAYSPGTPTPRDLSISRT